MSEQTLDPTLRAILHKTGNADVQKLLSALSAAEERIAAQERSIQSYVEHHEAETKFQAARIALADKMAEEIERHVEPAKDPLLVSVKAVIHAPLAASAAAYRASEEKK